MANINLGIDERALLEKLQRNLAHGYAWVGIDWGSHRGRSWGLRAQAAAVKLAKRGLVFTKSDGVHIDYHRGVGIHCYSWQVVLAPHVTPENLDSLLRADQAQKQLRNKPSAGSV